MNEYPFILVPDNNSEIVKSHDFEEAKKHILDFLQNTDTSANLGAVESSGGLFGLFDHKVTGDELNSLISKISDHLIAGKIKDMEIICELGELFNALDAMDRDYIQKILNNYQTANKAINDANRAINDVENAQKDIKKTIEEQKKIVKVLQIFKEKIDKIQHVKDIDVLWKKYQSIQENIKQHELNLSKLLQFVSTLQTQKHLSDIDAMWAELKNEQENINALSDQVHQVENKLSELFEISRDFEKFKNDISSITHISDIDDMWNNIVELKSSLNRFSEKAEKLSKEHEEFSHQFVALYQLADDIFKQKHIHDVDLMYDGCIANKAQTVLLNDKISEYEKQIDQLKAEIGKSETKISDMELNYKKKLNIALFAAGGSAFIAILGLILNIIGVI